MATPEPIRHPQTRQARAAGRTGLGLSAGRTAGVNPVPRKDRRDSYGMPSGFNWKYDRSDNTWFGDCPSDQTATAPGGSAQIVWGELTSASWAGLHTQSLTNDCVQVTESGFYYLSVSVLVSVTAASSAMMDVSIGTDGEGDEFITSVASYRHTSGSRFLRGRWLVPMEAGQFAKATILAPETNVVQTSGILGLYQVATV